MSGLQRTTTCRRAHLLDQAQLFDRRALHTLSAEDGSNKLHSKNSDPATVSMQTVQLGDLEGQADKKGQSALPFKPLCMTFQDVRYSVPFPKVRSQGRCPTRSLRPSCLAGALRAKLARRLSSDLPGPCARPGLLSPRPPSCTPACLTSNPPPLLLPAGCST